MKLTSYSNLEVSSVHADLILCSQGILAAVLCSAALDGDSAGLSYCLHTDVAGLGQGFAIQGPFHGRLGHSGHISGDDDHGSCLHLNIFVFGINLDDWGSCNDIMGSSLCGAFRTIM